MALPGAHAVRRALRQLLHQPSFAVAAIGTLALGIAAPTALFTIVHATLLQPLPYVRSQDLYVLRTTITDGRFTNGLVANEELGALSRATPLVAKLAYSQRFDDTVVTDAGSQQVAAYAVSQEFFDLFGLPMAAGRGFSAEDFQNERSRHVVLSDRVWTSLFARSSSIVGSTIRLGTLGQVLVVGVANPAFDMPHGAELWFSYPMRETIGHGFVGYVRLQPGVTPATLQGPIARVFDDLTKKYPDMEKNRTFVIRTLLDEVVGEVGPTVLIAFGATGLLFLLALVNVANLLLARGAARGRDMAVRTALGASRRHLIRQLLTESLLLSAVASAIGLALAYGAVRVIVAVGGSRIPRVEGIAFNPWVFAFAATVMVAAGLLIALVPALTIADGRLLATLNEGGRAGLQGRLTRRWLDVMIVAEITLAIALVAGAGRLLVSLDHLLSVDPGFVSQGRLAVELLLPAAKYLQPERRVAWVDNAETALRGLGATHVGIASSLPMHREWDNSAFIDIVGRPTAPENRPNGRLRVVNPDLFDAIGIKLLAGRGFTAADRAGSEPVAIISEAWRRKFLPGLDPFHERLDLAGLFGRPNSQSTIAIVGIANDVQFADVMRPAEPVVYLAAAQLPPLRFSLVITTADGHPERLAPEIRNALGRLDSQVPLDITLMSATESPSLVWSRLGLFLMGACGAVAVCLAWVGVFGVIAYVVSQRSSEMAMRLALGATRANVFGLIMTHGARLAGIGLVLGLTLAWWMGQLMSRYVFRVTASNLLVLGGSAVIVLVIAAAAMLPPARRAAAVKPGQVLRSS